MTVPFGNDKLNLQECNEHDRHTNLERIENRLTILEEGGTIDEFTVMGGAGDTDPQALWEKLEQHSTYSGGSHQYVYAEKVNLGGGAIVVRLFTDLASGGADTYMVKLSGSDTTPEYMAAKFSGYSASPFNSATHFESIVGPVGTSDLRIYNPYAIIKTSVGDSSPGYLGDKWADVATYNASNDMSVYAQVSGATMKLFAHKSDVQSIVTSYVATLSFGNVRFVKVENGDVNVGTVTSGNLQPGTCATMKEMVRNGTTGKLEEAGDLTGITYPSIDPVVVASGRWKLGTIVPYAQDPTKLALIKVDCYSSE